MFFLIILSIKKLSTTNSVDTCELFIKYMINVIRASFSNKRLNRFVLLVKLTFYYFKQL